MYKTSLYLLLLVLFIACSPTPEPIPLEDLPSHTNYVSAQEYQLKGDLDSALIFLDFAIKTDSTVLVYHDLMSELLYDTGDTLASQAELDYIITSNKPIGEIDENIAELVKYNIKNDHKDQVRLLLEKELELHKDDSTNFEGILNHAYHSYIEIGDEEHAKALLADAKKNHPESAVPYLIAADAYFNTLDYKHAAREYETYVHRVSNDEEAYYHLAICYTQRKSKSKAKKYYKKAADLGHKDACHNYRELTAKTRYSISSECCDGSHSSSTGRGTCSHHGGVCYTIRTPYKEYTMNCY